MPNSTYKIHLSAEVDRLFDSSSVVESGTPKAVILIGGVAAGKTTLREQHYSHGYVLIDSAEMLHHLSNGDSTLSFPDVFKHELELIGPLVTRQALSEKRHIVTEIIGADEGSTKEFIGWLRALGYSVELVGVTCDTEESLRRNAARGDNVSSFYAEHFQRRWIVNACRDLIKERDKRGMEAMFRAYEEISKHSHTPAPVALAGGDRESALAESKPRMNWRRLLLQYPGATPETVEEALENLDMRADEKRLLMQQGFSNSLAETYLDRKGWPRPPGWHTVFFYPDSNRPRNLVLFWLVVVSAATVFIAT